MGGLTIPILRWDEKRPRIGFSAGASLDLLPAALGAILSHTDRNESSLAS